MLLDNRKLYWLAASWAGIIHEKVKRHSDSVVDVDLKAAELFAGKNLGKAFSLANPLGRTNGRQEGKLTERSLIFVEQP
jgi:hypothetical protein